MNEEGKADHYEWRHRPIKSLDRSANSLFLNLFGAAKAECKWPRPVNSDVVHQYKIE